MKDLRKFIKTTIREYLNENNIIINDIDLLISKYYENNLGIDLYDEQNKVFYEDIVKVIYKTNEFLKNKSDKILYRIINAKDIDTKKLGIHYVSDINDINIEFLYNIGLGFHDTWDDYKILKVKVPYGDIDIEGTYFNNINNPTEFEITLKTDQNVKILDVIKYK
jgi:hypothetical protein